MKDKNNISQELLETVERYHNDTMPKAERLSFEARLQTDAEFKTLVDDIQLLLFGIEEQALKEKLEDFHEALSEPIKIKKRAPNRMMTFTWFGVAATIILLVGIFWFLREPSNSRLYAQYFRPDPGLPTTMSSTENFAFFDAMVNYKQGQYDKAIDKWMVLHEKEPQNDTINYFLGVAYLADKKEERAIDYLEEVANGDQDAFKNDAYYYLGLAYLKAENVEEARKNFKLSALEKAQSLLTKLKD